MPIKAEDPEVVNEPVATENKDDDDVFKLIAEEDGYLIFPTLTN